MSSQSKKSAEQQFRDAFERLKCGKPQVVDRGAEVTQNNVAREAGCDPSALKKDRYPILVSEIQAYKAVEREQAAKTNKGSDNRTKSVGEKLRACRRQRDELMSVIDAQRDYIAQLSDEIESLKEGKVSRL